MIPISTAIGMKLIAAPSMSLLIGSPVSGSVWLSRLLISVSIVGYSAAYITKHRNRLASAYVIPCAALWFLIIPFILLFLPC